MSAPAVPGVRTRSVRGMCTVREIRRAELLQGVFQTGLRYGPPEKLPGVSHRPAIPPDKFAGLSSELAKPHDCGFRAVWEGTRHRSSAPASERRERTGSEAEGLPGTAPAPALLAPEQSQQGRSARALRLPPWRAPTAAARGCRVWNAGSSTDWPVPSHAEVRCGLREFAEAALPSGDGCRVAEVPRGALTAHAEPGQQGGVS